MSEQEIFAAAIKLNREAQEAFVQQACGDDSVLLRNVQALLKAHDESGGIIPNLDDQASQETRVFKDDIAAGSLIAGRYKLIEAIGEGGMGSVWLAEQKTPIKRRVALKLIKAGMDSRSVIARFEAERQALALMDHPNIAKVLDGGLHGHQPFFVMELVKGVSITEYCDRQRLTPTQRLDLFVPVCEAIQHAHQKGIIHRDIKPKNVLVALYDDKPVVKVIDFGVAKATGVTLTEQSLETGFGNVVGTPQYMSPEQATLNNLDIDTRSDVYALGVLLYELMTGSTPFAPQTLEKFGILEMLRVVREEEPQRPSTRLSSAVTLPTLSANRNTEPKQLTGILKKELDWIVMKALEKDRVRRYQSASGFAEDIRRYLNGDTVHAHPPSAVYRFRKLVRKHKARVTAIGMVLIALLVGIAGTAWQAIRAERARREAIKQQQIAEENQMLAVKAAIQEREAREQELKQRTRAESANQKATEILHAMVSRVTGDFLTTQVALSDEQKKFLTMALSYYRELSEDSSDDLKTKSGIAMAAFRIGMIEDRLGRRPESETAFKEAGRLYAALIDEHPSTPHFCQQLAFCLNNLATIADDSGQLADAEQYYNKAKKQFEKLVTDAPNVPDYRKNLALAHNNLGALYRRMKRSKEANEQYQKALSIRERLVSDFPDEPNHCRDLAKTYNHLGILSREQGRRADAEQLYSKALSLRQKLVDQFPEVSAYRYDLAASQINFGNLYKDAGKYEEAAKSYRASVPALVRLVDEYPSDLEYRKDLVTAYLNFSALLKQQKRLDESIVLIRKGVKLLRDLTSEQPNDQELRAQLASSLVLFGSQPRKYVAQNEAESAYHEAIDLLNALTADTPSDRRALSNLAMVQLALAGLLHERGDTDRTLELLNRSIENFGSPNPIDGTPKPQLLGAYSLRARIFVKRKRFSDAISDWEQAIELATDEQKPGLRVSKAISQLQDGKIHEALEEVESLREDKLKNLGHWYGAACFYSIASSIVGSEQQKYADLAIDSLKRSIAAGFKDINHLRSDTDLEPIRDREEFKALLEKLAM